MYIIKTKKKDKDLNTVKGKSPYLTCSLSHHIVPMVSSCKVHCVKQWDVDVDFILKIRQKFEQCWQIEKKIVYICCLHSWINDAIRDFAGNNENDIGLGSDSREPITHHAFHYVIIQCLPLWCAGILNLFQWWMIWLSNLYKKTIPKALEK